MLSAQGFRRRPVLWKALLAVSLLIVGGCAPSVVRKEDSPPEIIVAAAANLSDAFTELGAEFTRQSGIKVTYSFGATADLAKQIENNAPFDVFAAADVAHVEALDKQNLLTPNSRSVFARGSLVIWTPPGSQAEITSVSDLTRDDVHRIAVAKPDLAPYGLAAKEALQKTGVWERVENKVIYAQNVSQARQFASTNNVDAALLPKSLVKPDEGRVIEIDTNLHAPIDQALGIIKASPNQDAARRYAAFVTGPAGQQLLARYGYLTP